MKENMPIEVTDISVAKYQEMLEILAQKRDSVRPRDPKWVAVKLHAMNNLHVLQEDWAKRSEAAHVLLFYHYLVSIDNAKKLSRKLETISDVLWHTTHPDFETYAAMMLNLKSTSKLFLQDAFRYYCEKYGQKQGLLKSLRYPAELIAKKKRRCTCFY